MQIIQSIQNRIYEIRGERVMMDKDLAALYETETKRLKEAVNRNIKRFPPDFMFQLTPSRMGKFEAANGSRRNHKPFEVANCDLKQELKNLWS